MNKKIKYTGAGLGGTAVLFLAGVIGYHMRNQDVQPAAAILPPKDLQTENDDLKKENQGLEKENESLDKKIIVLEGEKARMFNAELEKPFNPRDTQNFRGTYGSVPSFIRIGIGATDEHDGKWLEGRYTSVSEVMENIPLLTEVVLKAQEGRFFRHQLNHNELVMPIAVSGEVSALIDLGYNLKDIDTLAVGLFTGSSFADFTGPMKNQWDFKAGLRALAKGKDWQVDGRAGYQYRETNYPSLNEVGHGPFAEILGSLYLGKNFTAFGNAGISFLDGRTKGSGYNVNTDNLEVQLGGGLAWSPNRILQLRASIDMLYGEKKYSGPIFQDDQYSMFEVGLGARITPFAQFQYDSSKRLFTPTEDLFFDIGASVNQSPGKPFDLGGHITIGKKIQ
ncbi:MAG: hypothetical protein KAT77_01625 [Nanoarchaeota archaeon]|nr:hypothetical protein [Nanoarchaeota archaeon]